MKITYLTENYSQKSNLKSEHGLSILIETVDMKILFDTGASEMCYENAAALNISLENLDYIILSHAHYDHTGGFSRIYQLNPQAEVLTGKNFFHKKYNGKGIYRGIPFSQDEVKKHREIKEPEQINSRLTIFPADQIHNQEDTHKKNMFKEVDGKNIPDNFEEEVFAVIEHNNRLILINGCAHNGITNAVTEAEIFYGKYPDKVLGGFHLSNEEQNAVDYVINFFKTKSPETEIIASHCTGLEAYAGFINAGLKTEYGYCGKSIKI